MGLRNNVRDSMLEAVPSLRAFAISLCGNADRADDLVQETLLRALANIDSFQPGSNLPAWLFSILRNLFRSDYRKRRREDEDAEGNYAKTQKTQPAQGAHLEFEEFRAALDKLPQDFNAPAAPAQKTVRCDRVRSCRPRSPSARPVRRHSSLR